MKIGIVLYPTYGGSGVVATELGKALAMKGHEVHFISYSLPARLSAYVENTFYHEVSIANYPLFEYPPYESSLTAKLVDVVQFENLDVLHAHYAIPHASAGYFAKQILRSKGKEIPIITTLHGTDITIVGRDKSLKPVVEFSIENSDAVTCVSSSLKKDTLNYFDINKPIDVIPNFIDFTSIKPECNTRLKNSIAPNGEKIIIHTSNFRPVKRVQDIIKTFKRVRDVIPAKLVLVGDGPERARMEALCRELGVCDDISFLGKQEAVQDIVAIADLFMLPSEQESFGLAALEAMAAGVPVVGSNAGGIPELNKNGFSGFNVAVGDVDEMARKVLHILSIDNLPMFKKNALQQAQQFDINNVLPKYEELYAKMITKQLA